MHDILVEPNPPSLVTSLDAHNSQILSRPNYRNSRKGKDLATMLTSVRKPLARSSPSGRRVLFNPKDYVASKTPTMSSKERDKEDNDEQEKDGSKTIKKKNGVQVVCLNGEIEWEIEDIIGCRPVDNPTEYLVKWAGCPVTDDYGSRDKDWTPKANLCAKSYETACRVSSNLVFWGHKSDERRL
jgi:hypothetical protein